MSSPDGQTEPPSSRKDWDLQGQSGGRRKRRAGEGQEVEKGNDEQQEEREDSPGTQLREGG